MTAYMVSAERIELCLDGATTHRSSTELHADERCLTKLNRRSGSCSPLPYHLAKAPEKQKQETHECIWSPARVRYEMLSGQYLWI